ncbi:MAG: hypothetical protein F4024_10165, partial [Gammaproteobacteria bacterium]|nr:hypothetical protein [Gammaproteobacteria bacterium]
MDRAVGPSEGAVGRLLAVDANLAERRRSVNVLTVSLAGGVQRFVDDEAKFGVIKVRCRLNKNALAVLAHGTRDNLKMRRQSRAAAVAGRIEG